MFQQTTFIFSLIFLSPQIFAQDNTKFSPQLQEAIDFCGGITKLAAGECPPQAEVDTSLLSPKVLPAKNIKLCKAENLPGLKNLPAGWKPLIPKNVQLNAYFNATNGRYGFGGGPFLISVAFDSAQDSTFMAGRAVGYLPELPKKTVFERDLCNKLLSDPCTKVNGESRCPITQGATTNFVAKMPFNGSYRKNLPVNLRLELYPTETKPAGCVTKDNLSSYGEPMICFIIQGYIL